MKACLLRLKKELSYVHHSVPFTQTRKKNKFTKQTNNSQTHLIRVRRNNKQIRRTTTTTCRSRTESHTLKLSSLPWTTIFSLERQSFPLLSFWWRQGNPEDHHLHVRMINSHNINLLFKMYIKLKSMQYNVYVCKKLNQRCFVVSVSAFRVSSTLFFFFLSIGMFSVALSLLMLLLLRLGLFSAYALAWFRYHFWTKQWVITLLLLVTYQ